MVPIYGTTPSSSITTATNDGTAWHTVGAQKGGRGPPKFGRLGARKHRPGPKTLDQ
jgi:hypothetical protein